MHAVERGRDPRALPLFAFGGAGPVHAAGVAAALALPGGDRASRRGRAQRRRVPRRAARVRLRAHAARARRRARHRRDRGRSSRSWRPRARRSCADPARPRSPTAAAPSSATSGRATSCGSTCRAGGPAGLADAFTSVYRDRYGARGPGRAGRGAELARRLERPAAAPAPRPRRSPRRASAQTGERDAIFGRERSACPVYDRYALAAGTRLDGPAIVEERESTLVIPPGRSAEVTEQLAVVVR